MLGKLLKHEIRQSARLVMLIYASAAAVIGFIIIGMLTKVLWIGIIGSVVLYIAALLGVFMTLVSVIKNFYDSLYSNQGYLSFTLPVKSANLLTSKVLVSVMWIILSFVLAALCFLVIAVNARVTAQDSFEGIWDVLELTGLRDALPSGATLAKLLVFVVAALLMSVLSFVSFVYFSVTLANTRALQKHPRLFGFLIFFFIYGVTNAVSTKLTYSLPLSLEISQQSADLVFRSMDKAENLWTYGLGGVLFTAIVAVGLLILTGWIMEHKVNVK